MCNGEARPYWSRPTPRCPPARSRLAPPPLPLPPRSSTPPHPTGPHRPGAHARLSWLRRVKAAEVVVVGRLGPRVTSRHTLRLMASTRPPLAVTRRNSTYRSSTCFALMGTWFTGVPGGGWAESQATKIRPCLGVSWGTEGVSCLDEVGVQGGTWRKEEGGEVGGWW